VTRRWWIAPGLAAAALAACDKPGLTPVRYWPDVASESWCRLGQGVYAHESAPSVWPALAGPTCSPPQRAPLPLPPPPSTLAELIIEPGAAIEVPVRLPPALRGVGCRLDSVVIAHGQGSADLVLEVASGGDGQAAVPIAAYAQLPPPEEANWPGFVGDPPEPQTVKQTVKQTGSWVPDPPPAKDPKAGAGDRTPWPAGALLRFDGVRNADGFANVVFQLRPPRVVESEPTPADRPVEDPPPEWLRPVTKLEEIVAPPPKPPKPPELRREPLELLPFRHRIGIAAADSPSTIILRARERPFGIGVRSDREGGEPRLAYRPPGADAAMPTHLVPQLAVIVSRCGRPAAEILRDIR